MEEQQSLTWLGQLQHQAGVVSRQQALDAGFTGKAIEWRLRTGAWRRVYHGVYATFTGKLSREARLWAVVLRLGAGAVLSHETGAEIQHLTDKPSQLIHISVLKEQHPGRHTKIRGVVIHRSRGLVAEWQPPWHLPRTSVEDTVLDLIGAARTFDDAYSWISAAHPAEGRWRDTRRDNANLAQGVRTLRYGWPDVTEYRCRTAAEVAEVLRGQGWTGTLRRCGPTCTAVPPRKQGAGTNSRGPVYRQARQVW
jgi:putative AbiEi antitoxin of type IV toxin-antitoxin system